MLPFPHLANPIPLRDRGIWGHHDEMAPQYPPPPRLWDAEECVCVSLKKMQGGVHPLHGGGSGVGVAPPPRAVKG